MSIDLSKATVDEMRAYSRNELGINPPAALTKDALRKQIADAIGDASSDGDAVTTIAPAKPGDKVAKAARSTIMIHKTGEKGGDRDVPVGINGKIYLIQRGVEVDVPPEIVEVLKNAVEDRYEWRPDPKMQGGGELVKRQAHAYPFSVVN